ncbi:MAG: TRAP transporter permease [Bryobacteraceae bacterium]
MAVDSRVSQARLQSDPSGGAAGAILLFLGAVWIAFQLAIIISPQQPMIERPAHLVLALAVLILSSASWESMSSRVANAGLLAGVVFCAWYYASQAERLSERIEAVDPVLPLDVAAGIVFIVVLLEGVRRVVGWSLLSLLLVALFYGFAGPWFPGWSRFSGFNVQDTIDIMTMTTNGVLGLTTETSVQFVFYFVVFGAVYSAIGGGRLFIDIGLRASGRQKGGAAKAAVISSSLMGTISGSAVANVVSVGVFTIPLMRRAGYSAEYAAGVEAIASTGGQLMPPVMGVAAFVMAEILQIDYGQVALAAVIPSLAFYAALFVVVDLAARKSGIGTVAEQDIRENQPILPRLYLLAPPAVLIALLAAGRSATLAVTWAILACFATGLLRRESRIGWTAARRLVTDVAKQAAQVAIPIAAIGIIMAVAVQSNLALRFSARLIEGGGGNVYAALVLTIFGCILMGMGLPTVAAYIIGAVLFVPALMELGLAALNAHFFVMYYCVLSMITPPVALASFAAAGLAGAGAMQTGWHAFRLSLVLFLIPFGFAFDPHFLGQGQLGLVLLAFASVMIATAAWAVALVGFLLQPLSVIERIVWGAVSAAIILFPTGSAGWGTSLAALALIAGWTLLLKPRFHAAARTADRAQAARR